jgi:hypothetical protein
MILRRIATAFRRQDWFTVAVETMIVVFGVFIGLQVSNWNEARAHRAGEHAFLAQLRDELAGSAEAIDYQSRFVAEVVASGRRALAYLRSGEDCATDCEALLIDFFHASQLWGTPYDYTNYREAQRLGFPSNPLTRDTVQNFYVFIDGWQSVNTMPTAFRERVRGHFTPDASDALWRGCYRLLGGQIEEMSRDCLDDLKPVDAPAMLRDGALAQELQFWLGQNAFALTAYPDMLRYADTAMTAITDDIGDAR